MSYSPTGNVGDYYNAQGNPQDANLEQYDALHADTIKRQEEEAKIAAQKEAQQQAQEQQNANPVQEVGTAVVGAGIDLVEGIGSTAEGIFTGQILNPQFKPTWLQVDDEVEPMNKTVWGNVLRGIGEFGLGFAATGGLGHLAKVGKFGKGAMQLSNFVASKGKLGQAASGAAKSAAVTFVGSNSEGETLNDALKSALPWIPEINTTSPNDSPLEKKLRNVLDDLALGSVLELALGYRSGLKAAKAIDEGKLRVDAVDVRKVSDELEVLKGEIANATNLDDPAMLMKLKRVEDLQRQMDEFIGNEPEVVAQVKSAEVREARDSATRENIQLELELDPEISRPNPSMHPDFFDLPDKGVRGVQKNSLYSAMKDMLDMAGRGDLSMGRRASLVTDAAIKRMSRNNGELGKQLDAFAEEIQKGLNIPAGKNVGGLQTNLNGVKQLAVARYTDIVSTFPDLAKGDWQDISKMLLEDAITVPDVSGKQTKVMNSANAMALEMLMYDLNAAVADKATALHSVVNKVPMEHGINNLLDKVEAAFMMNQQASEFAGSLLRARRGDVFVRNAADGINAVDKQKQIKTFMNSLRKVIYEDPDMTEAMLRAFAETNGDVATMEALRRYAADHVFNWASLIGKDGAKSRFVDGMFTTLYNSILSAPKTMSRAFSGTNLLTVMRPLQIALGGATSFDRKMVAKGMHMAFDNMFGTIGEAWALAKQTHFSLVKNEAGPYVNQILSPSEASHWQALGKVIESGDSIGEKAMYRFVSTLQDFNNQSWVRYPTNMMQTIDAFSKTLIGRQELKARAFDAAWNESGGNVSKELLQSYENKLKDTIFSSQGEVVDVTAQLAGKEVALQLPLTGRLAEFDNFIQRTPIVKPFFMFMKTGANALSVVSKHMPLMARFNDEVQAVLTATADNLDGVLKYGITNAEQLAQARALIRGRIATGYMTVGAATGLYMSGSLSGNGPADRELRNAWIKEGWRPRSIKIAGKWVNYDGLEPFASFLALIADIGDNSTNLGEAATENFFRKAGYLIGMNLTNKSFLAGLQPLTDVLAFDGARSEVWLANLTNNFIPFSGARNELANIFNPGLREVERNFMDTISNRNPIFRGNLAVQHDPLDGSVIRDFDFPTRMWNSISPIQIYGKDTPTRRLLRDSGYDLATTFNTDSYGNRLTAQQRSRMGQLMGEQDIEGQLTELFKDPQIKKEIAFYKKMREEGIKGQDFQDAETLRLKSSLLYSQIRRIFDDAKRVAEVQMYQEDPSLMEAGVNRKVKEKLQGAGMTDEVERLFYSTPTR